MATQKTAEEKAAEKAAKEQEKNAEQMLDNAPLNMGGGGEVAVPAQDDREETAADDLPKGADGKNPVTPNNPAPKALLDR